MLTTPKTLAPGARRRAGVGVGAALQLAGAGRAVGGVSVAEGTAITPQAGIAWFTDTLAWQHTYTHKQLDVPTRY